MNWTKVMIALVSLLLVGCATTVTPNGTQIGIWTGNKMKKYDPNIKVDSSQIANSGAYSHAVALALADIKDPEARADAKEAMIAISGNNPANIWRNGTGINSNRPPAVLGVRGAFGRMYNPNKFPVRVAIRGLGSPYVFGPGEQLELVVPYGQYEVWTYNAETGSFLGKDKLDTSRRRFRVGDVTYDFQVSLDGI